MANRPLDTGLLDRAITFSVKAHAGTERRGKGYPYIVHPVEAMAITATMTSDQELLAAAVLHDTIEDTCVTLEQIREQFGERVAALVEAETDVRQEGLSDEESWRTRKRMTLERLTKAPREVKMVAIGDKLSNMRAIARDYTTLGEAFWDLFHVKEKSAQAWYYTGLAKALEDLADTYAYQEFNFLVKRIFVNQDGSA